MTIKNVPERIWLGMKREQQIMGHEQEPVNASSEQCSSLPLSRMVAFTLIELLVVIAIIGTLLAMLLPAVQSAREGARLTVCRNHLKQQGIAIHNFESAHKSFPLGSIIKKDLFTANTFGSDGVFANAFVQLLPWLEKKSLFQGYDMTEPWYLQDSRIAKIVLEVLNCPSNSGKENPSIDPFFEFASQTLQSPLGNTLATTDYVFSKGANDAFCINSDSIPNSERGLFDYNLKVRVSNVTDGLSRTFAVGEGASGPHWKLCQNPGCTTPDMPQPLFSGEPYTARQYWIGSGNVADILKSFKWASAGHFACTVDRMNKSPVTHFLFDNDADFTDCRGTLSNPANTHRVPNFRSDHPGGANFLYADGSVRFVNENIEMSIYRASSTIAGAEILD